MKKPRNISRFSGLLLLFSVLFTHVFSREFHSVQEPGNAAVASEKHCSGKDQSREDQQPSVSQLSFEVVVPHYAFDFGSPFIALLSPRFELLTNEENLPETTEPVYTDSYFEKLFEHHIAINAP